MRWNHHMVAAIASLQVLVHAGSAFSFGYYNVLTDEDEDSGTPMLEIGKCSPF
jgi:hypothetical protein